MKWIDANSNIKPPTNRILICYCPKWCGSGYQIAEFDGKKFIYECQPNDNFDMHVEKWAIFFEDD